VTFEKIEHRDIGGVGLSRNALLEKRRALSKAEKETRPASIRKEQHKEDLYELNPEFEHGTCVFPVRLSE
jgi:hypothetical protein